MRRPLPWNPILVHPPEDGGKGEAHLAGDGRGGQVSDGLLDGQAHIADVAVLATSGQHLPAEPAIFLDRQQVQYAGMGKNEYRALLGGLGRGVWKQLADHMGKNPDNITKMFTTKRPLRQDEVEMIESFIRLKDASLLQRRATGQNEQRIVRPLTQPSLDAELSQPVPLWEIAFGSDGAGGHMNIAKRTDDTEVAHPSLRGRPVFCIKVWNDDNTPYMPKGTKIFVTRSAGIENQWHMFGKPIGRQGDAMQGPLLAILLEKLPTGWKVRVGTEDRIISARDYPAAWQAHHFQY